MKILFAADGSDYTIKTANFLATHFEWFASPLELHILHIRPAIPKGLALVEVDMMLGGDAAARYYKEASKAALAPAEQIFQKRKIPFIWAYAVGDIAVEINAYAIKNSVDLIAMGSHGYGALARLVMGSVAAKVLASTAIPVLLVR